MNIPINTEKKLGDQVIELIRAKLDDFTWIDEVYPAAKVMTRDNSETYPGVYVQAGNKKILDLTPKTSLKSYVFFEKRDPYNISYQVGEKNTYNLSLIFWGQMNQIDKTKEYDYTDELVKEIVEVLRTFSVTGIQVYFDNVFSRYTLHNSEKQMFMYPYSAFKIDFTIKGKSCI